MKQIKPWHYLQNDVGELAELRYDNHGRFLTICYGTSGKNFIRVFTTADAREQIARTIVQ